MEIVYEKDLEDLLTQYPTLIEPGFQLIKRQKKTPIGIIDIFGKDKNNNYVVVELKVKRPNDKVIGQITRYMGFIKESYKLDSSQVRGIIVCKDITHRLVYSAKFVNNLELFKVLTHVDDDSFQLMPYFHHEYNLHRYGSYDKKDSLSWTRNMIMASFRRHFIRRNGELSKDLAKTNAINH